MNNQISDYKQQTPVSNIIYTSWSLNLTFCPFRHQKSHSSHLFPDWENTRPQNHTVTLTVVSHWVNSLFSSFDVKLCLSICLPFANGTHAVKTKMVQCYNNVSIFFFLIQPSMCWFSVIIIIMLVQCYNNHHNVSWKKNVQFQHLMCFDQTQWQLLN